MAGGGGLKAVGWTDALRAKNASLVVKRVFFLSSCTTAVACQCLERGGAFLCCAHVYILRVCVFVCDV